MTRRDYIALADCIRREREDLHLHGLTKGSETDRILYSLHKRVADVLKTDNTRFDRERFESACGFGE
jgi:hypothetical protein